MLLHTYKIALFLIIFLFVVISSGVAQEYPMDTVRITYNTDDQGEPWIAVHPLNPSIMLNVWSDDRWGATQYFPLVGFSFSTDGGFTWTPDDTMHFPPLRWSDGFHSTEHVTTAFNRTGTAYCCYGVGCDNWDLTGHIWGVVVSRTNYYGTTNDWDDCFIDTCTYRGTVETLRRFPYMSVDNTGILGKDGNIYVTWYNSKFVPNPLDTVKFSCSTDSGKTFSDPMIIDIQACVDSPNIRFPRIAVGPNGEVYLAYYKYRGKGNGEIIVKKSVNGGVSFPSSTSFFISALDFDIDHDCKLGECLSSK